MIFNRSDYISNQITTGKIKYKLLDTEGNFHPAKFPGVQEQRVENKQIQTQRTIKT